MIPARYFPCPRPSAKTSYRVMAHVKEFNSGKAVEVYSGRDKEIAMAYVRGYAGSGTYVHLTEHQED